MVAERIKTPNFFQRQVIRFKHQTMQEKIVLSITTLIFIAYAFSLMYPFYWAIINSGKTFRQYLENQYSLPKLWSWDNYKAVFELEIRKTNIVGMIFNSLWFTTLFTLCGLVVSTVTAYLVSKYKFPGRKLIFNIAIFIQVIPIVGSLPASFKLLYNLGMINNPALIWITWCGGFSYSFILIYSFFKSVSWEYAESAFIDGAGHLRVFATIMVPLILPAILSIFVINFIGGWNDYFTPYMFLPNFPTLSVGIFMMETEANVSGNGVPLYLATMMIALVPMIVLFACFQKVIFKNTVAGGLKG